MKFDEFIKQKVGQHQEAYNPQAWEKLSQQLDKAGMTATPKSSVLKWVIGGAVAAAAVTSIVLFRSHSEKGTPTLQKEEQPLSTSQKTISAEKTSTPITQKATNSKFKASTNETTTDSETQVVTPTTTPTFSVPATPLTPATPIASTNSTSNIEKPDNKPKSNVISLNWPTTICADEINKIVNTSKENIAITNSENNVGFAVKSGAHLANIPAGTYFVRAKNTSGEYETLQTINILDKADLNVQVGEIYYEKGLPFVPVRTLDRNLSNISWKVGKKIIGNQSEAMIPAFEQGTENVELAASNGNCAGKESVTINVPSDYNLLAVTAFNTNSNDARNRTFLPYALYERNTQFEMQILDPRTGDVIFTTNSVDHPWNGINQKTGELVAPNMRFVWTVRLAEKANLETKAVYQGVIMRVTY